MRRSLYTKCGTLPVLIQVSRVGHHSKATFGYFKNVYGCAKYALGKKIFLFLPFALGPKRSKACKRHVHA
jgi:hypothetical protein